MPRNGDDFVTTTKVGRGIRSDAPTVSSGGSRSRSSRPSRQEQQQPPSPTSYYGSQELDEIAMSTRLRAPPEFDGPTQTDRRCTDILFSLILLCCWVALTGLGVYAIQNGDYRVVLHPLDYDGNVCGTDFGEVDMTDYPYLYYVNYYSGGVCVKECPQLNDRLVDVYTAVTYGGIYQNEEQVALNNTIPVDYIKMADYSGRNESYTCEDLSDGYNTCFGLQSPQVSFRSPGINRGYGYAYYAMDTYEVFFRCFATSKATDELKELTGQVVSDVTDKDARHGIWNNLFSDLWTAREYILGFGFCVAVVIGFIYCQLLRFPGFLPLFVWSSILLSIAIFFIAGYYVYNQADEWSNDDNEVYSEEAILAARVSSFILFGIGAALVLLVCFLRNQIKLAMGCVKEASRAVARMPLLTLYPVVQCFGLIVFYVIWTVYAVHLASLGEVTTTDYNFDISGTPLETSLAVRTYEFDEFVEKAGWYMIFCLLWTSFFIRALGEIAVAMAIAKWYFTRDKRKINSGTVCASAVQSLWYHMGTAAFGSLLIAIIRIFRWIVAKIQRKAKEVNARVGQCLLCCCQCCLWCFEKCVKFLNKNAYIQTAIFSTPFCRSAREAFYLIIRNAGRIGAITYVGSGVMLVGKLLIVSVTTATSYFLMQENIGDHLYSLVGPCALVAILSYYVAGMFMSVFDMAVATILQCFIADEEMFDGNERFAEGSLKRWIDNYEEEEKRIAAGRN